MIMQKIITTVVEPMVSLLEGNETFLSSARTSLRNSRMEDQSFFNTLNTPVARTPHGALSWQGHQESNPDLRFWRPTC